MRVAAVLSLLAATVAAQSRVQLLFVLETIQVTARCLKVPLGCSQTNIAVSYSYNNKSEDEIIATVRTRGFILDLGNSSRPNNLNSRSSYFLFVVELSAASHSPDQVLSSFNSGEVSCVMHLLLFR